MVVVVGLIGSLWGPQQRNTITKYIIKPDGSIITNHFGIVEYSKSLKVQNLKQQHDDNLNCIIRRITNCINAGNSPGCEPLAPSDGSEYG